MGIQDENGWRKDSEQRDAKIHQNRSDGSGAPDESASVRKTARMGALWMVCFWLALLAVFYTGFKYREHAQALRFKSYSLQNGEMRIPRAPDGHFRVAGEINGHPVEFLVDTGASSVAVTEAFAQRAGLVGGQPTTFITANGPRPGRMLRGVPVLAGSMAASRVDIGTGLFAQNDHQALLGQSFLSQFDVILRKDHMLIKRRAQ